MDEPRKPRKKQIALRADATPDGCAAELISLLDSITQDGHISDEEAGELRLWLTDNKGSDLPAIELLLATLEHILADGLITPEERKALYRAVERVLPTALRENVKGRRIATELVEKARQREDEATARFEKQQERIRNRPIHEMDFMVAGVAYEQRSVSVDRYVKPGTPVYLVREHLNLHDSNAIQVLVQEGYRIGYVPRYLAAFAAPLLDQGCKQIAYTKKLLPGRRYRIPVIVAGLYREDSTVEGARSSLDAPERITLPPPSKIGCGCLTGGIAALVLLLLVMAMRL